MSKVNYRNVARDLFQNNDRDKGAEALIYDSFNSMLADSGVSPVEIGEQRIRAMFRQVFFKQVEDIYGSAMRMHNEACIEIEDWLEMKEGQMFGDWKKVSSLFRN